LGREADFLHSTIDTYIADAQRENKTKLVAVWNNKAGQTRTSGPAKKLSGKPSTERKNK